MDVRHKSVCVCLLVVALSLSAANASRESDAGALFKQAFRHGALSERFADAPQVSVLPKPSDPKLGDGDIFDYAKDDMTKEGHLAGPGADGLAPEAAGAERADISDVLSGYWNTGFGDPTKWGGFGGKPANSGGGGGGGVASAGDGAIANSGGGGGGGVASAGDGAIEKSMVTSGGGAGAGAGGGNLAELKHRCAELAKEPLQAGEAAESGGAGGKTHSKTHSVITLLCILVTLFLTLVLADAGFKHFYLRISNREYTCLRLKVVIDSASREISVLAFVLLCGYIILWSGAIKQVEKHVLGYEDNEAHLLTTLYGDVHFLLTSAMLVFMILTFTLVCMAEKTCQTWADYEVFANQPEAIVYDFVKSENQRKKGGCCTSLNPDDKDAMDFLTFRMGFAPLLREDSAKLDRVGLARKRNCDETTARFAHFNFAEYLAIILGNKLAHVVSISFSSWVLIEAFMLLLALPLLYTWKVQLVCFGVFGYLVLALHLLVRCNLQSIWYSLTNESPMQEELCKLDAPPEEVTPAAITLASDYMITVARHSMRPVKQLQPKVYRDKLTEEGASSRCWRYNEPGHTLFFFGNQGGKALVLATRLVILLTAISVILVSVAARIAYTNIGYEGLAATMVVGYFPLLVIVWQLQSVLMHLTVLTSVGAFIKPRIAQAVIDLSRQRFTHSAGCMIDWLVVAATIKALGEKEKGQVEKANKAILESFFSQISEGAGADAKVKQAMFVNWYKRTKALSAKSKLTSKAIQLLYKTADPKGDGLNQEQFNQLLTLRDQIEWELLYDMSDSNGSFRGALARVRGVIDEKHDISLVSFVEKINGVTQAHMGCEHDLLPLFKEARVRKEKDGKKINYETISVKNREVKVYDLVHIMLKYAPASRRTAGLSSRSS